MYRKNIQKLSFVVVLFLLPTSIMFAQQTMENLGLHAVKGVLYINGEPAQAGIQVDLVFPDGTETTTTYDFNIYEDETNYNLGFAGHDGKTGSFKIFYLGYELEPEDNKSVDIQSGVIFYYIDLHAIVPVNHAPNTPSNPDPDDGATGVSIDKVLSWSGGDPDSGDTVTYDVYFGTINPPLKKSSNQSGTSYDPGTLDYETTYYWKIVAWDNHGASIPGPIWQFTTAETSPTVKITKPICKSIYFRNRYIPRLLMPGVIIIGTIDIEASVLDDGGISMVKFYIDDQPRYTDYEEPYNWTWNERIFFRHTVKVVAYDIDGNIAEDSIVVRIFNLNK